jgi:hypothetical protein
MSSRTKACKACGSAGSFSGNGLSVLGARSIMAATMPCFALPAIFNPRAGGIQATSFGCAMRGACMRVQSIPDNSAASCAAFIRMTPSVTGGHLKAPFSSRFQ